MIAQERNRYRYMPHIFRGYSADYEIDYGADTSIDYTITPMSSDTKTKP
jgi:hypothetical protein